jgi:hypothetical protein
VTKAGEAGSNGGLHEGVDPMTPGIAVDCDDDVKGGCYGTSTKPSQC